MTPSIVPRVLTALAAALLLTGCPQPPEEGGGDAPMPHPPEGGDAPAAMTGGGDEAPAPGGGPVAEGEFPGFDSLIGDGESVSLTVNVKGASAGAQRVIDFVVMQEPGSGGAPELIQQVRTEGDTVTISVPANYDQAFVVSVIDDKDGDGPSPSDEMGVSLQPVKLAGVDVTVSVEIGKMPEPSGDLPPPIDVDEEGELPPPPGEEGEPPPPPEGEGEEPPPPE